MIVNIMYISFLDTAPTAAIQIAHLKYGEPLLEILLWFEFNSPDCVTLGSIPAKVISFDGSLNRVILPISL